MHIRASLVLAASLGLADGRISGPNPSFLYDDMKPLAVDMGDSTIWWCKDRTQVSFEEISATGVSQIGIEAMMNATKDISKSASTAELKEIARNLRRKCIGRHWDGWDCHLLTMKLRVGTWGRLTGTPGYRLFDHLRHSEPPMVKKFLTGGGLKATVPCPKGGGVANLFYRHVYKSGGLAIKKNLGELGGMKYNDAVDEDWENHDRCEEYTTSHHTGKKPVLFTFVRDPIEKFIAGYKEISSRHDIDDLRGSRVGTVEHAKKFIDNVMHGACDNGHVVLQIQNMFGRECESKFDFVGKLEKFHSHWTNLGHQAGCSGELGWPQHPEHKSNEDDLGTEFAMRRALSDDHHRLLKMLCWWTMPDFIAFNYELPAPCKAVADLNEVREAGGRVHGGSVIGGR